MVRHSFSVFGRVSILVLLQSLPAMAVDCYIDTVSGNDSNSGLTEAQPVRSQSSIPSSCTVAKYKRGSVFNEAVKVTSKITTYTNYGDPCAPLPKFSKQRVPNNGSLFSSFGSGVTIDGLYLAGSMSDSSMSNLINGVCVMLGSNSQLLNSEITNCDIGIMLSGEGNLVRGNYVHDLYLSVDAAPGVDPNAVGGAEGIFVNGSNNEVAYNSFVRCTSKAEWTGGSCDGGATEVAIGAGKTMSGVKVHHNFAYQSCGFFEMSSLSGSSKGTFADSEFYNNVVIDSGWLMLLQVNNTNTSNIRWENNTVVHRKSTAINPGMLVTVFTGTSSGVSGGALQKDTVYLTNNLFILEGFGATDYVAALDSNLNLTNTLTVRSPSANAGLVNIAGSNATDFDLVVGSPAIDQGVATSRSLDALNRTAPAGASMDVGAFEYGAVLASGLANPAFGAALVVGTGCALPSTGGAAGAVGTSSGGASVASSGGAGATEIGVGSGALAGAAGNVIVATSTGTATPGGNAEASEEAGGCTCRVQGGTKRARIGAWCWLGGLAVLFAGRRTVGLRLNRKVQVLRPVI